VRRIEARVGKAVLEQAQEIRQLLYSAAEVLKTSPQELAGRIEKTLEDQRAALRELQKLRAEGLLNQSESIMLSAQLVGALRVFAARHDGVNLDALRALGDRIRDRHPDAVAVFASVTDGKIGFLAVCGADAVKTGVKAGELVKEITALVGGSGGGRPDSATGGGKDVAALDAALDAVIPFVRRKVGV
jgi:alanyl-tRNA synthetase